MKFREKISHFREMYKRLYDLELENNKLRFEIGELNLRLKAWENKQIRIREEIGLEVKAEMAKRAYVIRIEGDGKYLISTPKEKNEKPNKNRQNAPKKSRFAGF